MTTRIRKSDIHKMPFQGGDLEVLFTALVPVTGVEPGGEVLAIDESQLKEAFRRQFDEWIRQNPGKVLGPGETVAPAPMSTSVELDDNLARQQKAQRAAEAEREAMILTAADARLQQWIAAGLLDVAHNQNLMAAHIQRNRVEYTAANLDIIVNHLKDQLHWAIWSSHNPQNVPVVEESQPTEVLGLVKGTREPQLPLNSSEANLKKASKAQVEDWLARHRKATGQEYVLSPGSHSAAWVKSTMN